VVAIVIAGLVMAVRPGGAGVRLEPVLSPKSSTGSGSRQEIRLGGEAEVLGNVRGRVESVLIQPQSRQIAAVQLGGGLMEGEAVPASAVLGADGNTLSLSDGWQDRPAEVEASYAVLRGGAVVVASDGKRLGRLRFVCYDPTSMAVTALAVETGAANTLIPMDRVVEVGGERIVTTVGRADVKSLRVFATDWEIRQAINGRLANDSGLQAVARGLRIDVRDQEVRVRGNVRDRSQADRIEQTLREITGVSKLDLRLTTDDQLAEAVRQAISKDPATSSARVQVTARSGIVDITGEAPDRSTLRRIDVAVQRVEGAQVVHNMVTVLPQRQAPAAAS
jgi:osmotically-inducible protein OsmY